MNQEIILNYLKALSENNNREWFMSYKSLYHQANDKFLELLEKLIVKIQEFDETIPVLDPSKLTFKIVRDTRFSKDKSPYNPTFRAHIAKHGKDIIPVGYYISLAPDNHTFIGAGLFASTFKEATTLVRQHIVSHYDAFMAILSEERFASRFKVEGETLKKIPKEFAGQGLEEKIDTSYLQYKSWYLECQIPDALVLKEEAFLEYVIESFEIMKPFNDFLNEALDGYQVPDRR